MTTNNALNAPLPLSTTQGGLGLASPTAHGILVGEGASAVTPIVLTNGQLLIGNTGSDPSAATITAGTGITVTNGGGTITLAAAGAGLTWSAVSGTTQDAAVNNGYFPNNAGTVTVTLPATAAIGSVVAVQGLGAGGWTLAANTGQTIQFGNVASTSGGSFSSTNQYDSCWVVCAVANTTWLVTSSISSGLTKA